MLGVLIARSIKLVGRGLKYDSNLAKLKRLIDESQESYVQHKFYGGNRYFLKMSDKEYIEAFIHVGVVEVYISEEEYKQNFKKGRITHVIQELDILSLSHLDFIEPSVTEVKSMMETIKSIK